MDGISDYLARVHEQSFDTPWPEDAFDALIGQPGVKIWLAENPETSDPSPDEALHGFALVRDSGEECEVLTIAVRPRVRRQGVGRALMGAVIRAAQGRGVPIILEVASNNSAAKALYDRLGFVIAGKRPRYYREKGGDRVDALIMKWTPGGR